ncbi:MAG: MOSC N-terminal beta barrel domain-containing protein [Gemmatimonadaceae bacterium]
MSILVSALFIYPIKSAAGIPVSELELDDLGAVNDRRWMLVDNNDRFITQREAGSLALIGVQVSAQGLVLRNSRMEALSVDVPHADFPRRSVIVWDDSVLVQDAGDTAAAWCSQAIGMQCRLVHIARDAERPLQHKYAGSVNPLGRHVALSDGAPLLLLSEASLATLNDRLVSKDISSLGWDRFRPSVVLSGADSHAEDTWHSIEINGVEIGVGSPCPRCVITTIDQTRGERSPSREGEPGGEPLRTLATYRRQGTGVMFGMNATNATPGIIRVGDEVVVKSLR